MRSLIIVAALSAATVYAKPVAQNGRWQPEWEASNKANVAGSVSSVMFSNTTITSITPPATSTIVPPKISSSITSPTVSSSSISPPKGSSSSVAPPPKASSSVGAPPPAKASSSALPPIAPSPSAISAHAPAASSPAPLGNPNAAPNPAPNAALVASLLNAPSASSRMNTLNEAVKAGTADFKFDFNPSANPGTPGLGGEVILANRANFPPLVGLGVAFATLWFEPCGLNTPHIHPRATEVLTLVTKGTLTAGFVFDNTFNMEVSVNLTQFQGAAFPQGALHWQLNNECFPQVAIAGFSDEDPGSSSIAQNFFTNMRDDVTLAALGFPSQITPQNFNDLQANIPRAFAMGIQNCYTKCGITPPTTSTKP